MKKVFIKIIIMYIFSAISFLTAMQESKLETIPLENFAGKKNVDALTKKLIDKRQSSNNQSFNKTAVDLKKNKKNTFTRIIL